MHSTDITILNKIALVKSNLLFKLKNLNFFQIKKNFFLICSN